MGKGNRALQGGGLAIIIISLVVVAASFAAGSSSSEKRITLANMTPKASAQLPDNATLTSVASIISDQSSSNTTSTHNVEILLGAGLPHSVAQPYLPGSIIIKPGDSVHWSNLDKVIHTVTSTYFNSGPIWPQNSNGPSTFTKRFDVPGIFSYFCQIHPYMSGTVYVGAQETQRQVVSTNHPGVSSTEIELPQNAAYQNKFGPYFIPANAIVTSGSRVTWVNHDFIAHTATASGVEKVFDTGPILPSQSKTLIINGTGRTAYFCEIHPWMQASLTIINPR